MRAKSKKLLDNLNKITQKPKSQFQREIFDVITNRYYIPNSLHTLPKSYDKAKRHEDKDWLDGEYILIDRVYGGIYEQQLRQKDLTTYKGKLYHKKRLVKSELDGKNFYSKCTVTSDGRWFDNCGFPIEPPKQVDIEPEAKPDEEDIEEQKRMAREREQRIIAGLK
jgi:hypothetical protein